MQRIPKAARDMAKGYFKNLGGQKDEPDKETPKNNRSKGYVLATIMIHLARYSLITLVSAGMAIIGCQLLFHFPAVWQFDPTSFGLVLPSILLWAFLVAIVRRTDWGTALAVGLLSPVLGGFLLAGTTGVGIAFSRWWATFPTGALTGCLIHRCALLGSARDYQ